MAVAEIYRAYSTGVNEHNATIKRRFVELFTFTLFSWIEHDECVSRLDRISQKTASNGSLKLLEAIRQALTIHVGETNVAGRYHVRVNVKSRQLNDLLVDVLDGNVIAAAKNRTQQEPPELAFINELITARDDIVIQCVFDEGQNTIEHITRVNRKTRTKETWLEAHIIRALENCHGSIVFDKEIYDD